MTKKREKRERRERLRWIYKLRGKGTRCPKCECPRSSITHTRHPSGRGGEILRIHECEHCGHRWISIQENA